MKAADSVSALTAVINGYNAAAYTSAEITNKLAAVDAAFAVSSADLAEALRRVGSTGSTAGVGLEELLGIVAATQQVTARGGAVIGNAFKTIFTRMQRPRVITALESLGVATKDAEQNVLGMMDVLKNLAGTYDQLAPKQQSLVAELVGGVFQVNVLKAALGDLGKQYSLYASAVKIANNATNEAERRNKELNTTISSQLIVTLNNLKKAGAEVGSLTFGPAIKDTLGGVNTLLGGFKGGDKEAEDVGSKVAKGLLTGIGAVLKGPGIALLTLGIFKMFERLSKFGADAMGSVLGFNRQSKDTAVIQQQIMATMQKNPMILASIASGLKTERDLHRDILAQINRENIAMLKMDKIAKNIALSMGASGYGASTSGPLKEMMSSPSDRRRAKGHAAGHIPSLSERRYEEGNARQFGAGANVKAKFYPGAKVGSSKGVLANNQEDVISPKKFQDKYGVDSKGQWGVIPKYGKVGRQKKRELRQKVQKAKELKGMSGGSIPNFVDETDVMRYQQSVSSGKITGKTAPKKGAKRIQDTRPSISGMVKFLNQDINNLSDKDISDYVRLSREPNP